MCGQAYDVTLCHFVANEKQQFMSDKRILFISQEIAPYTSGTETSDFGRKIAQNAHSHKYEVRTIMPKYGVVNERRNQLHEVIRLSGLNIPINDNDHPLIIKVASLQPSRIQVYFIDNDDYFQKETSDTDNVGSNRPDNDERCIFFARATAETVKKLKWTPKVIMCTGWFTALCALYIKALYASDPSFKGAKMIYCITDDMLNAPLSDRLLEKLKEDGITKKWLAPYAGEPFDIDMLHRIAINNADALVVSASNMSDRLKEMVEKSGLPVVHYSPEEDINKIYDFYTSLTDEK